LHQVGDLFELNVKLRCQKLKEQSDIKLTDRQQIKSYINWCSIVIGDLAENEQACFNFLLAVFEQKLSGFLPAGNGRNRITF
jgi:hypothetical protein